MGHSAAFRLAPYQSIFLTSKIEKGLRAVYDDEDDDDDDDDNDDDDFC